MVFVFINRNIQYCNNVPKRDITVNLLTFSGTEGTIFLFKSVFKLQSEKIPQILVLI